MEYVPPEIGECVQLKELHLPVNWLRTVPRAIGKCRSLEVIDVSSNNLTTLPVELWECPKLKKVYLYKNCIYKDLPGISKATGLTVLNINDNSIAYDQNSEVYQLSERIKGLSLTQLK